MRKTTTTKHIRALGGTKVTPRPRATATTVRDVLMRWLRKEERAYRASLTDAPEKVELFDRGYFLGRAHAYSEAVAYLKNAQ